jgi:hypothetical protein
MTLRTTSVIAALPLLLVACEKLDADAKRSFSRENTCPIERTESRERPELHPSMLHKPSGPAPEVAHDPQRLALWQEEQERARAGADRDQTVVEVRGCNHEELFRCHMMKGSTSFCMSMRYPDGADRWPLVP